MADRHWFGQTPSDWAFKVGDGNTVVLDPDKPLTFWSQPVGGQQYDDLLDEDGNKITEGRSASGLGDLPPGAIPRLQGPPGVWLMWVDGGAGVRFAMLAIDLGDTLALVPDAVAAVTTIQAALAALAQVARTGLYGDLAGAPVLARVATTGRYPDLSELPAPGLQIVIKDGDGWPTRASTAPDSTRPAMWIGTSPAPPNGGAYALDTDLWVAVA
ncbi:hypothetical protein [Actinomadura violacea]|uniref:Minor tail protein n=1 Tax=Actinomadura violacea TaxID=2819934 RepID=A0ABS3RT37_9ACTN|nr:hypothetical protein [Actinomadura violacea]MBO2459827.1 hypothetical protein [Actinomadura violacea]